MQAEPLTPKGAHDPHATKVAEHDEHADARRLIEEPHEAPQLPVPVTTRVRQAWDSFVIGLYLPAIFKGLAKTFEFVFRVKRPDTTGLLSRTFTTQYPEQRLPVRKGYRGEHRLKKDAEGHPKCVACFMCATACPAECITIVAAPAPADWVGRDKRPVKFDIDLLKCIYCGMCEEACPCDAIELTGTYTQVSTSRAEKVYDIDRLLRN
jgi:NADH-quinone oxidoreductase subunit I